MSTTVRLMTKSDIPDVLSIWKEVNLFQGAYTIETFFNVDSCGFYVAVENGTVVGSCAVLIHNDEFATIGLYAVRSTHQGKGIGTKVWKKAIEHVGKRNCFLNSVPEHFHTYKNKAGFTFEDKHNTVVWSKNAISTELLIDGVNGVTIEPLSHDVLERVIVYDQHVVGYNRSKIITNVMDEKDCLSLTAIKEGGEVCGYGCLKDNILGGKLLGPLYADAANIAELLLRHLLQLVHSVEQNSLTCMGIDANPLCTELAQKLGLEKECTLPRLYTKDVLNPKYEKVYSQMDLDFCNI